MAMPYERATSGKAALDEMQKILRAFGATSFGCMENFEQGTVLIQFEHHGRKVTLTASAKGYAAAWLRKYPFGPRMKGTKAAYEQKALNLGQVAVYSILRDWIKGQVTAVECDVLSFEAAFLGQILLPSGQTVHQHVAASKLLALAAP